MHGIETHDVILGLAGLVFTVWNLYLTSERRSIDKDIAAALEKAKEAWTRAETAATQKELDETRQWVATVQSKVDAAWTRTDQAEFKKELTETFRRFEDKLDALLRKDQD